MSRPTIVFDHHSTDYALDWYGKTKELHTQPKGAVAWTEAHGGYWVIGDYAAAKAASQDSASFSSVNDVAGGPDAPKGILIPPNPFQMALNEQDPPDSTKRRMIEAPLFTPRALARWVDRAKLYIDKAIDAILAKGGGDFLSDLCMPVPAKTTLNLVGVDESEWQDYAVPAHLASQVPGDHPDYPIAEMTQVQGRLADLVRQRKADPRDDMASQMAKAVIDGEPLDVDVAAGMLLALATGGFDTATTTACSALLWLGDNREVWPRVLESDKTIDNTVSEVLRCFPPNTGIARNVMRDVELCGASLRKGDRVFMSWIAANRDPKKFESPDELRVDRPNAGDHLAFSAGPHRCLGAPLARAELRLILAAVLRRIPNYRILKDKVQRYDRIGLVNGFTALPFVLD